MLTTKWHLSSEQRRRSLSVALTVQPYSVIPNRMEGWSSNSSFAW